MRKQSYEKNTNETMSAWLSSFDSLQKQIRHFLLTNKWNTTFKTIVRKVEYASIHHFVLFPQCVLPFQRRRLPFWATFIFSSANVSLVGKFDIVLIGIVVSWCRPSMVSSEFLPFVPYPVTRRIMVAGNQFTFAEILISSANKYFWSIRL